MQKSTDWLILNGNLHEEISTDFFRKNRAFRLGDGFFETVRVVNGSAHLWPAHYARIKGCAKVLKLEVPAIFSEKFLEESIDNLLVKNEIEGGGRLRFTFFREGEGTYRPTSNRLGFILEVDRMPQRIFQLNDKGISIDVFSELRKDYDAFSAFKMLGNHIYIQASIWAQNNNLNDAFICNPKGNIIEATASNAFIIKNGKIYTPSVADGCVGGVMRMALINAAIRLGIPVYESELSMNDITFADEVFLTNAIQGVSWVGSFRAKRYYHKLSDILLNEINSKETVIN